MGGSELSYVQKAFDTNWIAPLGPNVSGFETAIENFYDQQLSAAVLSSGTAGMHLGLKLLGVGNGDDVLCQSFTFSASANPITYLGANPIFIDSERDTWNISPELTREAIIKGINKGKKPKAIIAVHLYGMPYKVAELDEISREFDIPILEDSAEALGSTYNNKKCGSFGTIAVISFNGNKIITTSGGGALLSKNNEFKEEAVFLATQARDNAPHYQHSKIGHNYRMSNVLAGIGIGQMEVLEERVFARRANYNFYLDLFKDIDAIEFLEEPDGFYSNRWLSTILTPSFEFREKLRLGLEKEAIESRPLWKPMHMQPIFKKCSSYTNGISEDLFNRGLCLPSGSNLSDVERDRIADQILKLLS